MEEQCEDSTIDFVVLWVDGSDEKWLEEKKHYKPDLDTDSEINRYRDWDLLKYWFRGVDKYAPWVNKVHFVTCGQKPQWLDEKCPKLNLVNHEDYIDKKYLPLFNSSALVCSINKIPGLSEKFVLFNDDTFLINTTTPKTFFKNGVPTDQFVEEPIKLITSEIFPHILLNNLIAVHKYLNKKEFYKKNLFKAINPKYGKGAIQNLIALSYRHIVGIQYPHLPQPFLKTSFEILQNERPELFETALKNRFRSTSDITEYAMRYYQLLTGNFAPRGNSYGKYFEIKNGILEKICEHIEKRKTLTLCVNDSDANIDFQQCQEKLSQSFDKILPKKSIFEK